MCTVSYLPQQAADSFLLTSNRDETPLRAAEPPKFVAHRSYTLLYPKDPLANGTWICADNQNRLVCLLNGAFERHQRKLPYRRSRGLMALDFFTYANTPAFFAAYHFIGIEAFTMVIYDKGNLYELRWDETQKHLKQLDPKQAYIWSSATLYTNEIRQKRQQWFSQWLQTKPAFTPEAILHLHVNGGDGDIYNDFVMNRHGIVQTVSVTSVVKTAHTLSMSYHDLIQDTLHTEQLPLKKNDSC